MSEPVRVHWVAVQPTPYNAHLFRALHDAAGIDLQVHFARPLVDTHPWRTALDAGYASRLLERRFGIDWMLLRTVIREPKAFYLVAGWEDLAKRALILALAGMGRRFGVWTDTPDVGVLPRSPVKARLRPLWLRLVFARAKWVFGTGRPARETLLALGCPAEKIVDFPFFVDLDRLRPVEREAGPDGAATVFLSVGRLDNEHKGYDLALEALARVRERRPNCAVEYRLAGTGPDRAALERQARALGLADVVQFLNWTEPDALPELYRQADAFLHPARYDPFPVVVLEAMASGLPVIGSEAAGSVDDRVVDGVSGFVHASGSAAQLAEAMGRFLDRGVEERSRLKEEARRTAEEWPVERGVETVKKCVRGP